MNPDFSDDPAMELWFAWWSDVYAADREAGLKMAMGYVLPIIDEARAA